MIQFHFLFSRKDIILWQETLLKLTCKKAIKHGQVVRTAKWSSAQLLQMDKFNQFDGVRNWIASLMWGRKLPKQLKETLCLQWTNLWVLEVAYKVFRWPWCLFGLGWCALYPLHSGCGAYANSSGPLDISYYGQIQYASSTSFNQRLNYKQLAIISDQIKIQWKKRWDTLLFIASMGS